MLWIPNDSHDPYYNLAFEEYVFQTCREGTIFLLWRDDPAVVCGSYQNVFAEVNVLQAQARGVAVVRRVTGGGTVYHDLGNLNYTIIADTAGDALDYTRYLIPVVAALRRLGAPVSINRKSDIAVDGLKVSGSAQRVVKNRVLHHGTLLYRCDLGALSDLANGQRAHFETRGVPSVPWPVTNLIDHMADRSMDTAEFGRRLLEEIGREEPLEQIALPPEAGEQIRRAAEEKYRSWEWIYGKSPAFTCRRAFSLGGQPMEVVYEAQKGVIGPCTFTPERPALSEALRGQRLCPEELRSALAPFPEGEELYQYLF